MLACARIGAPHSVVFGGFSSASLADRINDAEAKVLITADGGYRRGEVVPLKPQADVALESDAQRRAASSWCAAAATRCDMKAGRDHWWHDLMADGGRRVPGRADGQRAPPLHPLHLRHDRQAEGHPAHDRRLPPQVAFTHKYVFDLQRTRRLLVHRRHRLGHRPQLHRLRPAGQRRHERHVRGRARTIPGNDRFWEIIEKYGVTIFYTAPTAIRAFMKWGDDEPAKHDLSSLRLLGSVGEPINPEAWMWYREHIGGERCPVVDTWWQTETGGIMISPLPGRDPAQARLGHVPVARHRRRDGRRQRASRSTGGGGYLTLTAALARHAARHLGRPRALPGDLLEPLPRPLLRRRRRQARRRRLLLAAGPRRRRDERLRPPHLDHRGRVRARVAPERGRGGRGRRQRPHHRAGDRRLRDPALGVRGRPRATARCCATTWPRRSAPSPGPKTIIFTPDLPKTRSGKIMRRLLRDVAEGRDARRHHHARRCDRGRRDPHARRPRPQEECRAHRRARAVSRRGSWPVLPVGSPAMHRVRARCPSPMAMGGGPRRRVALAGRARRRRRAARPSVPSGVDRARTKIKASAGPALPRLRRGAWRPAPARASRRRRPVDADQRHVAHPGLVRRAPTLAHRSPVLGRRAGPLRHRARGRGCGTRARTARVPGGRHRAAPARSRATSPRPTWGVASSPRRSRPRSRRSRPAGSPATTPTVCASAPRPRTPRSTRSTCGPTPRPACRCASR